MSWLLISDCRNGRVSLLRVPFSMSIQTSPLPTAQPRQNREPLDPSQSTLDANSGTSNDDDVDANVEKLAGNENAQAEKGMVPSPKPMSPEQGKDPSLVEFDGPNDPGNPKNWAAGKKIAITCSMGLMTFVVTFSSSIFSVAIGPVAAEFGISTLTATLGVTLFLLVCLSSPRYLGLAD